MTKNNTASADGFEKPLTVESTYVFGAIFIPLFLVGTFGNSLVIFSILFDRKMRSVMNLLLLNLAIADTGNLLTTAPEWIQILALQGPGWIYPVQMCPLLRSLSLIFLYTSIYTQVAVAIERYVAIKYPMEVRQLCSRTKITLLTVATWLISIVFAVPNLFYHFVIVAGKHSFCIFYWKFKTPYKLVECLIFYFLPLVILVILYTQLALVLWNSSNNLTEGQSSKSSSRRAPVGISLTVIRKSLRRKSESGSAASAPGRRDPFRSHFGSINAESFGSGAEGATQRRKSMREKKEKPTESLQGRQNVVKMLMGCVAVYFISYSPIQTLFVSETLFSQQIARHLDFKVHMIFNAFTVASSACNPIIYTVFSSKFRRKFFQILGCRPLGGKKEEFSPDHSNMNSSCRPYTNNHPHYRQQSFRRLHNNYNSANRLSVTSSLLQQSHPSSSQQSSTVSTPLSTTPLTGLPHRFQHPHPHPPQPSMLIDCRKRESQVSLVSSNNGEIVSASHQ